MKVHEGQWDILECLDGGIILCSSYEIAGTLGRDELESDAEEDAVGCHAYRQSTVREQAAGSGSLAGADGDAPRADGSGGSYRGRVGGTAEGTKGTRDRSALVTSVASCMHCLTQWLQYCTACLEGDVLHFLAECFDVHHMVLTVSSDYFPERSQLIGFVMKMGSFYWAEGIDSLNIIRTVVCLKFNGSADFSNSTTFSLCTILRKVHFQQLPFVTFRHQFQSRDFVDYTAVHPTTESSPKAYHRPFPQSVKTARAWIRTKVPRCSEPIPPPYSSVAGCLVHECFILSVCLECTV